MPNWSKFCSEMHLQHWQLRWRLVCPLSIGIDCVVSNDDDSFELFQSCWKVAVCVSMYLSLACVHVHTCVCQTGKEKLLGEQTSVNVIYCKSVQQTNSSSLKINPKLKQCETFRSTFVLLDGSNPRNQGFATPIPKCSCSASIGGQNKDS